MNEAHHARGPLLGPPPKDFIPVVLSGGVGTRLWPISRSTWPKQFCEILDESLLEKTIKRLKHLGDPWTVTTKSLQSLTERCFADLSLPASNLIFEPAARNTAPAVALLLRVLQMKGHGQAVAGVFPADHLVLKEKEFASAIHLAVEAARQNQIVTLGIRPDRPATGFGYIETDGREFLRYKNDVAMHVRGFREKPNRETAERFLAAGNFFWNAGVFVFSVAFLAEQFERIAPEIWQPMQRLQPDLKNLPEIYESLPAISFDYAIMEKLHAQVCIPCDIGWSDMGSWDDLADLDFSEHRVPLSNRARVVTSGAEGCFVFSPEEKTFGLVGVQDITVVDTNDATLIVKRGSAQDVKNIVMKLEAKGDEKSLKVTQRNVWESRPWGSFTVLRDEGHYKSKLITVSIGAQISYQSHAKRAEHWVVVRGEGEVILDDKTIPVEVGSSVFIPIGAKHRIRNTGQEQLEFIEVQTGTYFGEDDIKRFADDYNRV